MEEKMHIKICKGEQSLEMRADWFYRILFDLGMAQPDPKDDEFLEAKKKLIAMLDFPERIAKGFSGSSERKLISHWVFTHVTPEQGRKLIELGSTVNAWLNLPEENFRKYLGRALSENNPADLILS